MFSFSHLLVFDLLLQASSWRATKTRDKVRSKYFTSQFFCDLINDLLQLFIHAFRGTSDKRQLEICSNIEHDDCFCSSSVLLYSPILSNVQMSGLHLYRRQWRYILTSTMRRFTPSFSKLSLLQIYLLAPKTESVLQNVAMKMPLS
jgi:hypothetical protein